MNTENIQMMKTMSITKKLLSLLSIALIFGACVEDDDFATPDLSCTDAGLTATVTIQEVFDASTGNATLYTADDVIEGYVVSSDEGGNFFKSLSIQAIDNSIGFSVPIDVNDLYTEYEPGRRVWIRLQDRYTAVDFDALEIGDLFGGNQVGRIPATIYRDVVVRSCEFMAEDNIVNTISIQDIGNEYLNKLVQFENVQFNDDAVGSTYYDADNDLGGATNHLLTDEFGFQVIFRTSSFASFAGNAVAEGNGTVRGVLTKFGDDFQLLARTLDDIMLESPREDLNRIGIGALRTFQEDETINDERIVEGIVILSGNNEDNITGRNAVVQDETGGIVFRFDSDGHNLMEGDLVRVSVDGLNTDSFNGLKQLETIDFDAVEVVSTGNPLPEAQVVTIADMFTGEYESELVQIDNVQFLQAEVDAGDDISGSQTITDCDDVITIFTRSAATFAGDPIATGNGSIVAVGSTFQGNAQLNLRNLDGIAGMTGTRCEEPMPFFVEEFNAGIPADWTTVATTGTSVWEPNDFGGVFYVDMSAFQGSGNPIEDVVTWLITPSIDMDAQDGESMTIFMADAFQNGNPLKIFFSTDYDGTGNPNDFTWTQIGADETAGLINNGGFFDNVYEESDAIDLSGVSGNAHIAFVYDSAGGTISTTLQLDRVEILSQ